MDMMDAGSIFFSEKMIEEVMADWEREHPGSPAHEMSGKEFADRLMAKAKVARMGVPLPGPEA